MKGNSQKKAVEAKSNMLPLQVHVDGGLPTGRDMQNLLAVLECCLVRSGIALATEARRKAVAGGHVSNAARVSCETWDSEVLGPLRKSYSQFLTQKYRSFVYETLELSAEYGFGPTVFITLDRDSLPYDKAEPAHLWLKELLRHLGRKTRSAEGIVNMLVRKRLFADHTTVKGEDGPDFSIEDFNAWIGADLGRNLLVTQAINPDASIRWVFDIAGLVTIIALQQYPTVKELVKYAVRVLRGWMGKAYDPAFRVPTLPPEWVRLLGKYDYVDVTVNKDEVVLKLKRKKTLVKRRARVKV